ncbi:unnamed protein product [Arctia plantaginis]|uniref:PiggyBac transposable element-derived protein domain-containing protein n=1 Tax=Arctia plantaginis TaxID=874455 RepID=A0A8S0ZZX8_ARCPL|nr:unnamed protein product [Arctia plantaginis]
MGYIVTVKYIAEVTGAPHGAQIQKIYFPVPGAAPPTPPATRYTSSALALTLMCEPLDMDLAMEEFEFTQDEWKQINASEISFSIASINNDALVESDSEPMQLPKKKRRLVIASDSDSDSESAENFVTANITQNDRISSKWSRPKRRQPSVIPFIEFEGMKPPYSNLLKEAGPDQYYDLLVPEEILEMIAEQTNLFASQNITARQTKPGSRSHSWKPTNKTEIKQFLGLVLFMGVVKLPKLAYYWSKDKILGQTFPATVMSRNRFELLLQYLHFSDNLSVDRNDRIAKIRPLIDDLNATFQKYYSPKEDVCVDERQVPFRGRIIFRQYNKTDSQEIIINERPKRLKHVLKLKEGKVRDTRRFCVQCYKDSVQEFGKVTKNKAKK